MAHVSRKTNSSNRLTSFRLGGRQASKLVEEEEQRPDLGFGTRFNDTKVRLLNKDGSFNVRHVNASFLAELNLFHRLIVMPWPKFFGMVILAFVLTNFIFAGVYSLLGYEHLMGIRGKSAWDLFWEAYFFSVQTLTTVGYGRISPVGFWASAFAALESLTGLLTFALATGLLYARFSRPTPRIRFSETAVFAPYLDVNAFMFRIVNERSNQLIDVEIDVTMSRLEPAADGSLARKYFNLTLERRKVAFFPTNWTLVHPITAESPLVGCTPEKLEESDTEFLIILHAVDDTFSQQVHLRYSYRYDEIRWGHKFVPMFNQAKRGMVVLDVEKLSETREAPLNL